MRRRKWGNGWYDVIKHTEDPQVTRAQCHNKVPELSSHLDQSDRKHIPQSYADGKFDANSRRGTPCLAEHMDQEIRVRAFSTDTEAQQEGV